MKILVLGCGEMGLETVRDLIAYGTDIEEIVIATRSPEKSRSALASRITLPSTLTCVPVDVSDEDAVASLMDGCAVAINCAGPNYLYELPVARAAIRSGVSLVDLNDEYDVTPHMYDLDQTARDANILILFGLGGCPGINNVLVRAAADQLDSLDEIHTSWVMSGADPGGRALSYHLLHSLSGKALTVENGRLREVESFIDGAEEQVFPEPVGAVTVYHIGHPEPLTLSRTFPDARVVDNKATFVPASVNTLIRTLGEMQRTGPATIPVNGHELRTADLLAGYLHRSCTSITDAPPEAALRVSVKGMKGGRKRTIGFSSVGRLASATGIPAAIGALMIARGALTAKGALPPEACVDAREFLYEILDRRHLADLNGWTEE